MGRRGCGGADTPHPHRSVDRLRTGGSCAGGVRRCAVVPETDANAQPAAGWTDEQRQDDDRREVPAVASAGRGDRRGGRLGAGAGAQDADAVGTGRAALIFTQ